MNKETIIIYNTPKEFIEQCKLNNKDIKNTKDISNMLLVSYISSLAFIKRELNKDTFNKLSKDSLIKSIDSILDFNKELQKEINND